MVPNLKLPELYLTETGGNCVAHKTIHEENTRGAPAIERWTPCSYKKTCKKGRFSRTGDVRAYSGKGIKIAEIWREKKGILFNSFDTRLGYIFY